MKRLKGFKSISFSTHQNSKAIIYLNIVLAFLQILEGGRNFFSSEAKNGQACLEKGDRSQVYDKS
jgi:hypothetical protein